MWKNNFKNCLHKSIIVMYNDGIQKMYIKTGLLFQNSRNKSKSKYNVKNTYLYKTCFCHSG